MPEDITIKTIPSKYFFSGNIILTGGQEVSVDLLKLTETQIVDILEAEITKVLLVSDIEKVKKRLQQITENTPYDDEVLNKRIGHLEKILDDLTVGEVSSVTYWASTDW